MTTLASMSDDVVKTTTGVIMMRSVIIGVMMSILTDDRCSSVLVLTASYRSSAAPSSCRRAAAASPAKAWISRRMRSRSSSDGRSRMLLDELAEPLVAEAVALRVHRLGDAVGVEQEEIAGAERQRRLPREPSNRSPCRSSGRAPGRPASGPADVREARVRPRARRSAGSVPGARVGQRPRAQVHDGVGHRDEAARSRGAAR